MRLIDLVVDCLKEYLRNGDLNFGVESICDRSAEKNPEYVIALNNVLLSINKGIARLTTAEKLKFKHVVMVGDPTSDVYDISDYKDIKNIKSVFVLKNGQPNYIGWTNLDKDHILLGYGLDINVHMIYAPKMKRFTFDDIGLLGDETNANGEFKLEPIEDDLDTKYGIDDEMCTYLGYFAKSELWEDVDPDRCKRYLNYFEQWLVELKNEQNYPHQTGVSPVYKIKR